MKADLSQTLSKLNVETHFPLSHTFIKLAKAFWFLNDGQHHSNHRKIWNAAHKISTFQDKFKEEASLSVFFRKISLLNKAYLLLITETKFSVLITKTEITWGSLLWHLTHQRCRRLSCDDKPCCGCGDMLWLQCSPPFVWAEFQRPESLCADRKELGSQSTVLCSG